MNRKLFFAGATSVTGALVTLAAAVAAISGCARVAANYPEGAVVSQWASNFEGPQCEYEGVVFRVREKSDTVEVRNMLDSLGKKLADKVGQSEADRTFDQAQKGHELGTAMREDREFVFYRGSLVLAEEMAVVIQRGCLLLTIQTDSGIVTVPDSGIIFPKHENRNDYRDSGQQPVQFDLGYNRLLPGDENRLQIRSGVIGKILRVAVDANKLTVEK
jgi:hypothetical protein